MPKNKSGTAVAVNKKAIGIDIGGTKISIVVGDHRGKTMDQTILSTRTGAEVPGVLDEIEAALSVFIHKHGRKNFAGIGIGIPGPVDSAKGIVPRSPNLKGWENLPLAKIFQKKTGLPVVLAN